MRRVFPCLVVALALVAAACGSNSKSSSPSTTTNKSAVNGNLTVFAAASLTGAFNDAKPKLTAANPDLNVTYNFAGSNALVAQIQQGAPADVFASADQKNIQALVAAGLVETPVTFVKNKLEIAVAAGNPKGIFDLADLAHPGVSVVLEAQGVPAGDYTRLVLAKLGITVTPKSLETDVKAGGPKVQGVTIPDADQPDITYPIAVVKATTNHAAAQAFVDSAVSGDVQKSLEAAGFSSPK